MRRFFFSEKVTALILTSVSSVMPNCSSTPCRALSISSNAALALPIPFIYQKIGMHGRKSHPAKPPAAKAGPIQKDAGWFVLGRIFEYAARTPRCHRLFRLFLANIAMHEFRNAIPVSLGQVKCGFEHKKTVFFAVHQQGSVTILQFRCREDPRATIDNGLDFQEILQVSQP